VKVKNKLKLLWIYRVNRILLGYIIGILAFIVSFSGLYDFFTFNPVLAQIKLALGLILLCTSTKLAYGIFFFSFDTSFFYNRNEG
jgi:hypothetical protein